jgi:hypothetical protein
MLIDMKLHDDFNLQVENIEQMGNDQRSRVEKPPPKSSPLTFEPTIAVTNAPTESNDVYSLYDIKDMNMEVEFLSKPKMHQKKHKQRYPSSDRTKRPIWQSPSDLPPSKSSSTLSPYYGGQPSSPLPPNPKPKPEPKPSPSKPGSGGSGSGGGSGKSPSKSKPKSKPKSSPNPPPKESPKEGPQKPPPLSPSSPSKPCDCDEDGN